MSKITVGPEHSTYGGAVALAHRIEKFWADRGHRVPVDVHTYSTREISKEPASIHDVRSNLVNGMPPAARA